MLEFETEFSKLMTALWSLNKAVENPTMRREIGRSMTFSVPKFDFARPAESKAAAADLERDGYHLLGQVLSAAEIAEVQGRLADAPLYDWSVLAHHHELADQYEFAAKGRPDNVFLANYKFEDLIRCRPLLRLACDPRIVAAVETCIGCTPTVSAFLMWHSFPGELDAPTEIFHRDRDCFSFVKLFTYLSDVDADAGPHEFIKLSHSVEALQAYFQANRLNVDLPQLFKGNARHLNPADVQKLLGRNVVRFTGPAGFAFLENTFGFHRGTRPLSKPRQIFSVTYTGLPLRYGNESDRNYEMSRKLSFEEIGLPNATALERYMLRFFLQ